MTFKFFKNQTKGIIFLGLLSLPFYFDMLKEIPSLKYVNNCRNFQKKLYENYKKSKDLYEAYKITVDLKEFNPVGIECLLVDSRLVPVKSINVLSNESELGENLFYYQTGNTYGQKIIHGLKKALSKGLSDKFNEEIKALRFEFKN